MCIEGYVKTKELQEVQNNMLFLLKCFHKYCIENNIKYSLHGGTLLGAIRECGFIPWDDDIDITMTRKEYTKFVSLVHDKGLPNNLILSERQPIIKIIMKEQEKQPVWIDIFIWDYISSKKMIQKFKIYGIMFFQIFLREPASLYRTKKHGKYTGLSYITMAIITYLGQLFPYNLKLKWMNKFIQMYGGKHTLVHRANDQLCGISLILPADITDSYILVPFEDSKFFAFKKYKEILENTYGIDYMVPKRNSIATDHSDTRNDIDSYH